MHVLLGLHGLVQAVGPAAAVHDAAGELIHDEHLAVFDHVLHVALEEVLGLERLLEVVHHLPGRVGVEVLDAEELLHARHTGLGGRHGALGLVELEVLLELEARRDLGERLVGVRRARAGARDDERGPRLVDEDRVHLVHDRVVVAALHPELGARDHVVAQVVEAELAVGAVRDVGGVGGLAGLGVHAGWMMPTSRPRKRYTRPIHSLSRLAR